mgnify:FL=1|jgi:hypothetical protein
MLRTGYLDLRINRMRFVCLALWAMGCSDTVKLDVGDAGIAYDDITVVTTTDVDNTGCDSAELCDTAG